MRDTEFVLRVFLERVICLCVLDSMKEYGTEFICEFPSRMDSRRGNISVFQIGSSVVIFSVLWQYLAPSRGAVRYTRY